MLCVYRIFIITMINARYNCIVTIIRLIEMRTTRIIRFLLFLKFF